MLTLFLIILFMALVAQHSSHVHPNNPLVYYSDDREYTCHGCRTVGFGARFQCQACPVSIHVYCSDCPRDLYCFFHSHCRLLLVAHSMHDPPRTCDLCRESITGLSYRCRGCDFDVHPLCTQFPEELRHVIDVPEHKLRLQKVPFGSCGVCRADCSSHWVYGCGACRVNVHPQCLRRQYDSGCASAQTPRIIRHAPSRWTATVHQQQPAAGLHQLPSFHFWYPGPVPFVPYDYHYGAGGYWQPPPPPPPPPLSSSLPLSWGSFPFVDTIFSLIGDLAAGAINGFVFGSVGF